ncbi:LysM peptidoglycan-binding domain-containing protein [Streptomyces sp. T028]|uniref:LysM peptidoglycan-binding domain-containing protein n=1 Tax=Streptomyces sp. T028 TaxID=3394379 RepID=UPI003A8B30AD
MLSGNGRHRRPRQAPALLVAAGVTGSAIALPLLAAGGASAADGTVWDKVAQCETGGSWSAYDGNDEFGGLSLSQEEWETYGGLDYASRPDLASRNQQIAVAQKLLAAEDVGAFGTCGLTSGLTKLIGAEGVGTGTADDESDSSDSSESSGLSDLSKGSKSDSGNSGESGEDSSTPSGDASASPSESPSSSSSSKANDSGKSGTSGDGEGGTQGADSSPTVIPEVDDSGNSVQDAGTWSLVDTGSLVSGRHRGATADEAASGGTSPASSGRHAASTYTVREGDTLGSIADSLGVDGGWRALYAENRDLIGADPSDIMPGQTLDTTV